MVLLGCSAPDASELLACVLAACSEGRAVGFHCDGSDAVAVVGDSEDTPSDVRRFFLRAVFEAPE